MQGGEEEDIGDILQRNTFGKADPRFDMLKGLYAQTTAASKALDKNGGEV